MNRLKGETKDGKTKLKSPIGPPRVFVTDEHLYHCPPQTELSRLVKFAAEKLQPDILDKFLQSKKTCPDFDVNERDMNGLTGLHYAAILGKLPLVKLMIEHGADIDIKENEGFTPLFCAIGQHPSLEIARYILEDAGGSVYSFTNSGASPLHFSAVHGNVECTKLLLQHNADPRCEDQNSITPMYLAKNNITESVMYRHINREVKETEKNMGACSGCGAPGDPDHGELKRCARCRVTLYCNKDCQAKDWTEGKHKETCPGSIIINTGQSLDSLAPYSLLMNWNKPGQVRLDTSDELKDDPIPHHVTKSQQFLVKVQVPLVPGPEPMLVYNEDRSLTGYITSSDKGYDYLRQYIEQKGHNGQKAFFWSKFVKGSTKTFRVFHGRAGPYQTSW